MAVGGVAADFVVRLMQCADARWRVVGVGDYRRLCPRSDLHFLHVL